MKMRKISLLKDKICMLAVTIYLTIFINPVFAFADGKELAKNFADFAKEYNIYIAIFIAIGILTGVLGFIVNFMKLGHYSTNPRLRQEAIRNLLACGITTAILVNFGFVLGFYFKIILG